MQPGVEPVGLQHRCARGRRGDDELAFGHQLGGIGHRLGGDAERRGEVGGAGAGLLHVAAVDEDAGEGPDQR